MIVYRSARRVVHAADVLELAVFDSHEERRRFLIHFGELEAALADEGCDFEEQLRELSLTAARLFCSPDARAVERLRRVIKTLPVPKHPVRVSVPEGYAYYGLFPETYAESALKLFRAKRPNKAVCIGIRSIGTSLSAVVAATLERLGCSVRSWTVRPDGHPFDRRLHVSHHLEAAWKACSDATFVIVDEGPGLSGSSFASVAEKLSELGIPDHRICFLPAWNPSGESFRSEAARRRWIRHQKFTTEPASPPGRDISAGKWRALVYSREEEFPEVQPQHEARKFLCPTPLGPALRKFAGLANYGRMKFGIAAQLAAAGFSPPAIELCDGYVVARFVEGRPARAGEADRQLLDVMARYLAFRRASFRRDDATPIDELRRMVEFNSGGTQQVAPVPPDRPCLVDGRMLPHEWISTASGYIKVDGLDHGDNHFYPGPTDIAWDLAGATVEFRLREEERNYLIDAYENSAKDWRIRERLPFYTTAYAAFRLGYTKMNGFDEAARCYKRLLAEGRDVCK